MSFLDWLGFNAADSQTIIILAAAWILVLLFRSFLSVKYRDQFRLVKASVKDGIKSKEDAAKASSAFFRRAAADYAELGERGFTHINSRELCVKSAAEIKILFFSLGSAERLVKALEPVILSAGVLAAILSDRQLSFVIVTFALFVLVSVISAAVDPVAAKEELISRTAFFLDREIGKLYVTDEAAAVHMLKGELKTVITYQSQYLSASLGELGDKLTSVTEKTLGETARAVESTLNSVSAAADIVRGPLEEWRAVLVETGKSHETLNAAVEQMSRVMDGYSRRTEDIDKLIEGYKLEFLENNKNVEKTLATLKELVAAAVKAGENANAQSGAVSEAIDYVRRNQSELQNSLNQYETALKDITSEVGDGLGKILSYHTEFSAQAIADGVADSIKKLSAANGEIYAKLQSVLEGILEQGRKETTMILNLKEQLEIETAQGGDDAAGK